MKKIPSLPPGFSSRAVLLAVLFGLFLWWVAAAFFHPLRAHSDQVLSLAVAILAARMLLTERSESAAVGAVPAAGEEKSLQDTKLDTLPAAEAERGGIPSQLDLRELREETVQRIADLARRLSEERRQRQAAPVDPAALAHASAVSRVAEELATLLEGVGESAASVRSLRDMAARLQAASASGAAAKGDAEPVLPLASPEEWLAKSHARPIDYLTYLQAEERQAQARLDSCREMAPSVGTVDWRTDAETLLLLVGRRRTAPGGMDPAPYHRLHKALLDLLKYEEIPVAVGDPINREIHAIETTQATDQMRPNRVLVVRSPGYRDRRTGKVWRKANVVLSEQQLQ
jgi:hypothetical protein